MKVRTGPADEQALRSELRSWLSGKLPFPDLPACPESRTDLLRRWQRTLFDGGWVGVSFPVDYGGRGMTPVDEAIVGDELGAAGAPAPFPYGHAARTLLEFGDAAQRRRHVRPALRGDEQWSLAFAESGAETGPASVATVAFPTRRGHRVTGCKLVTADALRADWFLVLARTGEPGPDPTSLSCLILPARAPGLTLEVTDGGARLALDGVRVGESALVGRLGEGWAVAVATLANDGGPAGTGRIAAMRLRLARLVAEVVALDLAPGHPLACALTRLHGAVEGLGRQALRTLRNEAAGIRSVGGLASGAHDEAVACAEASLADLVTQVAELQVAGAGRPA